MKNVTPTSNITPLNANDLASIYGGTDDVIDPDIFVGTNTVVEDVVYI